MSSRAPQTDFEKKLAESRKKAKERQSFAEEGTEWPAWEAVGIDTALQELTIAVYDFALKVGIGIMSDGQGVWVRMTYPGDANHFNAGCVCFTVSDTVEKAIRKAVQLLDEKSPKLWKPDQFSRDRPKERL